MGLDENYAVGEDEMKNPRGVLDYSLSGHNKSDITWKLTGNLGGEDYADHTRGPLNEGGMYAERQGYHQPGAPTSSWQSTTGALSVSGPGIEFYETTFDLNMPSGYDIPLSVSFGNITEGNEYTFSNGTARPPRYRCLIFVNGYQFGKYVRNIGPQDVFPVPEGIWNFQGKNTLAINVWSAEEEGVTVKGLQLVTGPVIQTALGKIQPAPQPAWTKRPNAY